MKIIIRQLVKIAAITAFLIPLSVQAANSKLICATALSDSDGDGWGWENGQSCLVVNDPCVDSDGDGWGWDGESSCLMPGGPVLADVCTDTPPLHDTWGWNGTVCRVPPALPQESDTSAIAGLWDVSDDEETVYLHISGNGSFVTYFHDTSDTDTDCFIEDDPNAIPEEYGARLVAFGGNQYEIYSYEIFNTELYEYHDSYEMFVTVDDSLSMWFAGVLYDNGEFIESEILYFPPVAQNVESLRLCEI